MLKTNVRNLSIKEFEGTIVARAKEIDFSKTGKCLFSQEATKEEDIENV